MFVLLVKSSGNATQISVGMHLSGIESLGRSSPLTRLPQDHSSFRAGPSRLPLVRIHLEKTRTETPRMYCNQLLAGAGAAGSSSWMAAADLTKRSDPAATFGLVTIAPNPITAAAGGAASRSTQ